MTAVGALFAFSSGHKRWLGVFILALAALVLTGGFFVPPLYFAFRRFGEKLGKWAGIGMSWILLAPFFYIFFTIGRMGLALKRKDPLHRAYDSAMDTYWTKRPAAANAERYRRQY